MGVYDQAQSQRLAQRTGIDQPGIRLVYLEELPEIAYRGQLIYNGTSDNLLVYDGAAWQPIGDASGSRLFVQPSDPNAVPENGVVEGDQWLNTSTLILTVFDGSYWTEPALPEDSVGPEQIIADSITTYELAADAITVEELGAGSITAKHTIIGSTIIGTNFFTADPNAGAESYMQMVNDANGGIIYFHYGMGETFKGFLNPRRDGSRPMVTMASGTMHSDSSTSAQLRLFGAYAGGAGKKAEMNCDLFLNGAQVSTSSRRYKEDIEDLHYSVEEILSLRPVAYTRKDSGQRSVGFIAEEAEEAGLRELVIKVDGRVEAFNYPAYTAVLQKVVREQQTRIDDLEARLSRLEARLVSQ